MILCFIVVIRKPNNERMPTMTKQTLNRQINRHSLENHMDDVSMSRTRHSRYSLTSIANKENFGVHFTHSPFGSTSFIALHDLSNGKSPLRPEAPTSLRRRTLEGLILNSSQVTSATDKSTQNKSISHIEQKKLMKPQSSRDIRFQEETLSSSRMGDITLDEVLEAIIDSARKEVKNAIHSEARSVTPVYDVKDFEESSFHEMEVRTPPHLKRQRVVRRKNTKTADKKKHKNTKFIDVLSEDINNIPYTQTNTECLTPVLLGIKKRENMANLCVKNLDAQIENFKLTPIENEQDEHSVMPAMEEAPSIKRCLSFSSDDDVDYSVAKRSSVASSNASSMNGDLMQFNSGRWSRNSQDSIRGEPKGCLELAAFFCEKVLNVHVKRCRDLMRPNGVSAVNAYVKVVVINKDTPDKVSDIGFQRTAVHRHSSRPHFDHWFKFDLTKSFEKTMNFDVDDRLQLAVWHRDRQLKRSEFLGCLSFSLHTLLQHAVNGVFKLQSQTCLNNPQLAVPILTKSTIQHIPNRSTTAANQTQLLQIKNNTTNDKMTSITSQQYKSEEDVVNIDTMAQCERNTDASDPSGGEQPMILSKKALHQRDADENLFLRFLELDPPSTEAAPNSSSASTAGNNNLRRLSNTNTPQTASKFIGRTPFTMTKRLTRTAERGFGFSIVWTHPPRVEKVEPGLSADRKGILPGDYVIFVDKHNVVTMPEADVLNLIRSQGSTLTLEIFRRQAGVAGTSMLPQATTYGMNGKATGISCTANDEVLTITTTTTTANVPSIKSRQTIVSNNIHHNNNNYNNNNVNVNINSSNTNIRPSTVCSVGTSSSVEAAKRRLNLPQVTFSKESIVPITDNRRRFLLQLISREQNFISALHFGMHRFVQPLQERKDLMTPNDHRTLFQNIDELLRISEDILEQLSNDGHEPQMNFASRVYLSKTMAICAAYKKYCNGIKRADCILVNKSRQGGSEFLAFINEPPVPRKRPDLTMFIHRPLQHFREILKLMQMLVSNCLVDSEEYKNFMSVLSELQAAYREITVSSGLMEPLCEGRPLLTLQDLESRMVFTKCKPFTLAVQGRQWIFGGDLTRVEGRSMKPYWTLLFSDIIVFAKVSRDRVLFITEEPVPIANIVDSCFNMRKKTTEFRLTVDPNGRLAESPTGYCAPDLSRTPKKGSRRKSLILRAPSLELKAVWQNLLQRQIFLVNAALGSTPLSSPLDSPDVLNTLVPLSDIGFASTSISSIKIPSMDSINLRNQQTHHIQQPQQPQQNNQRLSRTTEQIEMLIDEKCRILNKTGTPKSSALHLANWMKGQLDKQQERALLATDRSAYDENHSQPNESDNEERITYWTRQQLEKRTKELNLEKEQGLRAKANNAGKRLSGVEELSMSEASEAVSQISQSHSTTSDSQITVRSSPIVLDKLAVCRHCHKNCQKTANEKAKNHSPTKSTSQNSLAQKCHHQISPSNDYLQVNGKLNHDGSDSSLSSSTITVDKPSERSSSKLVASSRRETGDTESDFAQLITDDVSQSEATNENVGPIPSISSFGREAEEEEESTNHSQKTITNQINSIRILNESIQSKTELIYEKNSFSNGPSTEPSANIQNEFKQDVTNMNIIDKTKLVENHNENTQKFQKKSPTTSSKSIQFIPCNCKCDPADFENATLSPDELEQQTCKLIASPKQSPQYTNKYDNSTLSCVSVNFSNTISEGPYLPTIAIVPATPEAILTKTSTNIWDNKTPYCNISFNKLQVNNNSPRRPLVENMTEDSCDESPLDEELPYRPMCNTLRRYGTMSSLEKLPSDERNAEDDYDLDLEDQCDNADDEEDDLDENARADSMDHNQTHRLKHTGDQSNNKSSFFEESRAFIDKYLNRWSQDARQTNSEIEEQLDECTSGATSGEEVWGTPTSGGDNDDMHLNNSENTYSSPTKSSHSINDDDDTELMMDELLMAPPMTASAIRGLLPRFYRRRLEPLFEEETESDEEKTQQESDDLQKGDTRSNGRPSEKSSLAGSDAEETNEPEMDCETVNSAEERIPPNLQMRNLGPRPLRHPDILLPTAVLKASACETLLESKSKPQTLTMTTNCSQMKELRIENSSTTFTMAIMKTNVQTSMTTNSTTMNNVNVTTNKDGTVSTIAPIELLVKPMKQHPAPTPPPPPPPRRLISTQNKSNMSGINTAATPLEAPKKFGVTVDDGLLVDATKQTDVTGNHTPKSEIPKKKRSNVKSSLTIIETSMLGSDAGQRMTYKSSTTALEILNPTQRNKSKFYNQEESHKESSLSAQELTGLNISPKIEMRLALKHDLIDDENLMCYIPGTNLTNILGHDLSTYQRLTGRDLLSRSANPSEPAKEAAILCSQQRNSKMDTPTVNRRPPLPNSGINYEQQQQQQGQNQTTHHQQQTTMTILGLSGGLARVGEVPQHLQPNRNTWSNSAFVARSLEENVVNANVRKDVNASSNLRDLELSTKQEMIYCMSQSKSGSQQVMKTLATTKTMMAKDSLANRQLKRSSSANVMQSSEEVKTDECAGVSGAGNIRKRKIERDDPSVTETGRRNRILNFLKRRNSEVNNTTAVQSSPLVNKISNHSHEQTEMLSPRKDVDKPSLNRRLWKQITRRRRASSMSEIVANS